MEFELKLRLNLLIAVTSPFHVLISGCGRNTDFLQDYLQLAPVVLRQQHKLLR